MLYNHIKKNSVLEKMGMGSTIACVLGSTALSITALSVPFVTPALRRVCIPYVPASDLQIQNVKRLVIKCSSPVSPIIDLGSGDGRVVSLIFINI